MDPDVQAEVDHFMAIPWCRKHLDRPDQTMAVATSRQYKNSTQYLFSRTLNTASTIPRLLFFYDRPSPSMPVTEVRALITLGEDVAGHKGVCHGGVVMSLLDEVAGELGGVNQMMGTVPPHQMLVTAYLNTKFIRPLMVPSTVYGRSWMTKVEGRKYYVEVVIEDENGVAVASAEAMFMAMREKL